MPLNRRLKTGPRRLSVVGRNKERIACRRTSAFKDRTFPGIYFDFQKQRLQVEDKVNEQCCLNSPVSNPDLQQLFLGILISSDVKAQELHARNSCTRFLNKLAAQQLQLMSRNEPFSRGCKRTDRLTAIDGKSTIFWKKYLDWGIVEFLANFRWHAHYGRCGQLLQNWEHGSFLTNHVDKHCALKIASCVDKHCALKIASCVDKHCATISTTSTSIVLWKSLRLYLGVADLESNKTFGSSKTSSRQRGFWN